MSTKEEKKIEKKLNGEELTPETLDNVNGGRSANAIKGNAEEEAPSESCLGLGICCNLN